MGVALLLMAILLTPGNARAVTLTEDFEDSPFGNWESQWLGTNSNLMNYYVEVGDPDINNRGNNPDGLWIADGIIGGGVSTITFINPYLGTSSFAIDVASHGSGNSIRIFDSSMATIYTSAILTGSAFPDPGDYDNHSVNSLTGIGGFEVFGGSVEGYVGIDNVVLNHDSSNPVPEPATVALLGIGLVGLAGAEVRRRRKKAVDIS